LIFLKPNVQRKPQRNNIETINQHPDTNVVIAGHEKEDDGETKQINQVEMS
jgi:hypothetical protein